MDKHSLLIADFAAQHAALYNRFCAYAPELTTASPEAMIIYIPERQQVPVDLRDIHVPIYLLLDMYAQVVCAHALHADTDLTAVIAPNARLQVDMRHFDTTCTTLQLRIVQHGASSVIVALLSTAQLNCNIMLHLRDTQAQADVRIIALAKENEASMFTTLQDHTAAHTKSSVQVKTVLADAARATHQGMLDVAYGATGVIAYEQSDHMLLSSVARAYVVPAMQVRNHDVQCMHASALGHVDQQLLWYMQSRGMTEYEARLLLLQAFLAGMCTEYPELADAVQNALKIFIATVNNVAKGLPEHGITS